MNLPKRDELLLRIVFAFPNASSAGTDIETCSSTVASSSHVDWNEKFAPETDLRTVGGFRSGDRPAAAAEAEPAEPAGVVWQRRRPAGNDCAAEMFGESYLLGDAPGVFACCRLGGGIRCVAATTASRRSLPPASRRARGCWTVTGFACAGSRT